MLERPTYHMMVDEAVRKAGVVCTLRQSNRGMSNAFALLIGFFGIVMFGFMYAIFDQIVMGELWNFAISQQLSGTMLQLFKFMFQALPVLVPIVFMLGMIVLAHKTRD